MLPPKPLKRGTLSDDIDELNVPQFGERRKAVDTAGVVDAKNDPWKMYFDRQLHFEIENDLNLPNDVIQLSLFI